MVSDVGRTTEVLKCRRCGGLMCAVDLHDWESGTGQDQCQALRCIGCGEIVDSQIIRNRTTEGLAALQRKSRARHNHPIIRL